MKINDNEKKVLIHLLTIYGGEFDCTFFKYIAKATKLSIKQVRRACRSLKKKGLTDYVVGLFNDNGEIVGSGYCATELGRKIGDELGI